MKISQIKKSVINMKRGKMTNETDVSFCAAQVWQVYSTLELPELIKTIPDFLKDIKVTGDGSVGTTYDLWNLPGAPFDWYKEKVVHLDHDEFIKEVDVIGGGVLNFGYTSFRTRFEILDKGPNRCTVKSIVMYELEDQYAANEKMTTVDDMGTIAVEVEKYLESKNSGGGSGTKTKRGKKTNETDVAFPASEVWKVYSTLILPKIIKAMPNFLKDIKVTGDGSVGTTYDMWMLPGGAFEWYKEKVIRLDHEELIKEVDVIEGGVLNFGFTFFRTQFQMIKKGIRQCTVKSIVMYEILDKYAENEKMATVDDLGSIALAVEEYLKKNETGTVFNTHGLPQ